MFIEMFAFFQSRIQGIVCKVQSLQFKEHDNEIKQRISELGKDLIRISEALS